MKCNRFVLCNMAAKAARKFHLPHKDRVEETLKLMTKKSKDYLLSGTEAEQTAKNVRQSKVIWELPENRE
jgi:hypothetical protein